MEIALFFIGFFAGIVFGVGALIGAAMRWAKRNGGGTK